MLSLLFSRRASPRDSVLNKQTILRFCYHLIESRCYRLLCAVLQDKGEGRAGRSSLEQLSASARVPRELRGLGDVAPSTEGRPRRASSSGAQYTSNNDDNDFDVEDEFSPQRQHPRSSQSAGKKPIGSQHTEAEDDDVDDVVDNSRRQTRSAIVASSSSQASAAAGGGNSSSRRGKASGYYGANADGDDDGAGSSGDDDEQGAGRLGRRNGEGGRRNSGSDRRDSQRGSRSARKGGRDDDDGSEIEEVDEDENDDGNEAGQSASSTADNEDRGQKGGNRGRRGRLDALLTEASAVTGSASASTASGSAGSGSAVTGKRERKQTTFYGINDGSNLTNGLGHGRHGGGSSRHGADDGGHHPGAVAGSGSEDDRAARAERANRRAGGGSGSSGAGDHNSSTNNNNNESAADGGGGGVAGHRPKRERRGVERFVSSMYDEQERALRQSRYGYSSRFNRDRDGGRGGGRFNKGDSSGGGAGAGGNNGGRRHYDSSSESDRGSRDSDSMRGGPLDSSSGSEDEGGAATLGGGGGGSSRRGGKRGGRLDKTLLQGWTDSITGGGRGKGAGGVGRGMDGEEADFDKAQERRHAADLAAIQPWNAPKSGGGSDPSFRYNKRDIARADASPLAVDSSLSFSAVGGLDDHIRSLKEMVTLPLLYPEVFSRFGMKPPRGVLFHGPPGTGKTLVARALANQCSTDGRRISFFMGKGAQLLSKWLGESERQLRLIFEQARTMQPSIVFFDEFDAIAPVRSSKQDQIHSSIVGTLLALLDGLDDRGNVIVIGATNRPDAIDPALRRPGRFDRELYFPLPSVSARKAILGIHTKAWHPPLAPGFLAALARATTGYCGADLAALCSEAALRAVRRRYPQIYDCDAKLRIKPDDISVALADFAAAMRDIVPAAARSARDGHARAAPPHLLPLLAPQLSQALAMLQSAFPFVKGANMALLRDACAASAGSGAAVADVSSASAAGISSQPPISSSSSSKMLVDEGLLDYDSDNSEAVAAVYGQLNRDECDTCGQPGSLVCCDACPAAFCCPGSEGSGSGPRGRGRRHKGQQHKRSSGGVVGGAVSRANSSSAADGATSAAAAAADGNVVEASATSGETDVAAASSSSSSAAAAEAAAIMAVEDDADDEYHPGTCIPASGPLPDMNNDDAQWLCPACTAKAVKKASSSSSSSRGAVPDVKPSRSSLNIDAVLTSAGKRPCYRPRLTLLPAPPAGDGSSASSSSSSSSGDDGSSGEGSGVLLPVGSGGGEVGEILARSLLHACEEVPVLNLDMASLQADPNARSPIEALIGRVAEARRSAPSILYLPSADAWWSLADDHLRAALASAVEGIPADLPVLLLATLAHPVAKLTSSTSSGSGSGAAASVVVGGLTLPAWAVNPSTMGLNIGVTSSSPAAPQSPLAQLASALPTGLSRLLFGATPPATVGGSSSVLDLGLGSSAFSFHPPPAASPSSASSSSFSSSSSSAAASTISPSTSNTSGLAAELAKAGVLLLRTFTAGERRAFFAPLWASLLPKPSYLKGVEQEEGEASLLSASTGASLQLADDLIVDSATGDDGSDDQQQLMMDAAMDVARRRTERRERKAQRNASALERAPPPPPPPPPTAAELAALKKARQAKEEKYLKSLRIGLRSVLDDLARDPKYRVFGVPVDPAEVPDYYSIVSLPMDFQTMSDKVEAGAYLCYDDFTADLRLIYENCREYNPASGADVRGKRLVRNAHAIADFADIVIRDYDRRVGGKLLARCAEIKARRIKDGEAPDQRTYMLWGYPSGVAPVASNAAILTRLARAYGLSLEAVGVDAAAAAAVAEAEAAKKAAAASSSSSSSSSAAGGAGDESLSSSVAAMPARAIPTRRSSRGAAGGSSSNAGGEAESEEQGSSSSAAAAAAAASGRKRKLGDATEDANDIIDISGEEMQGAATQEVAMGFGSSGGSDVSREDSAAYKEFEAAAEQAGDASSSSSSSSSSAAAAAVGGPTDVSPSPERPPKVARVESPQGDNEDKQDSEADDVIIVSSSSSTAAAAASGVKRAGSSSSSASSSASAAAAKAAAEAATAARIQAALSDELASMQRTGHEYRALQPRAAGLLSRLVAVSEGWDLGQLERVRHGLAAQAEAFAAAQRAARKARVAAAAAASSASDGSAAGACGDVTSALPAELSRSSLLDVVEAHLAAWEAGAAAAAPR